nr:uncharacterized protein LOC113737042 [Coffea arabica]
MEASSPEHDDGLKFLPCVMPNCSLNYSCAQAPPPAPAREKRANESIFDPCYWAVCGGGTCNKTSIFGHKCECQEGYYNILNVTAFPCFRECELGMDCKHLGIGVMNNTPASSPPSLPRTVKTKLPQSPLEILLGRYSPWYYPWLYCCQNRSSHDICDMAPIPGDVPVQVLLVCEEIG